MVFSRSKGREAAQMNKNHVPCASPKCLRAGASPALVAWRGPRRVFAVAEASNYTATLQGQVEGMVGSIVWPASD